MRGRTGFGTRGRFAPVGGAGAPAASLSLLSGGTFTRSTEGSYLTGVPTDGSTAFLAWAATNTRRIENRGDAMGASYLNEGARTNIILRSEEFGNAAWTTSALTVSTDSNNAPDGGADADTLVFTAAAAAQISQPFSSVPADAAMAICTVYLRAASAQTVRLFLRQKDGATEGAAVSCAVTALWQRFEIMQAVGTGVSAPLLIIRNHTDAAARSVFAWGAQVECNAATVQFPSSYIRTAGVAVARDADRLTYAVGEYPASFVSAGWRSTFAPLSTSAEMIAGTDPLVAYGFTATGDTVLLSYTGGNAQFYLQNAGNRLIANVSWSRDQACGEVVAPNSNNVVLSGFTIGNGSYAAGGAFTFGGGTLYIGHRSDALFTTFGRFSNMGVF